MTSRGVERAQFEKTASLSGKAALNAGTGAPATARGGVSAGTAGGANREFHAAMGSRAGWTGEPRLPGVSPREAGSNMTREFHPEGSSVSNFHPRESASVRSFQSPAYHHSFSNQPSYSGTRSYGGMQSYSGMHSYGGMHSYSGGSRSFSGGGSRGFSGGGSHGSMGGHR
jgi:hypothetical protein